MHIKVLLEFLGALSFLFLYFVCFYFCEATYKHLDWCYNGLSSFVSTHGLLDCAILLLHHTLLFRFDNAP